MCCDRENKSSTFRHRTRRTLRKFLALVAISQSFDLAHKSSAHTSLENRADRSLQVRRILSRRFLEWKNTTPWSLSSNLHPTIALWLVSLEPHWCFAIIFLAVILLFVCRSLLLSCWIPKVVLLKFFFGSPTQNLLCYQRRKGELFQFISCSPAWTLGDARIEYSVFKEFTEGIQSQMNGGKTRRSIVAFPMNKALSDVCILLDITPLILSLTWKASYSLLDISELACSTYPTLDRHCRFQWPHHGRF